MSEDNSTQGAAGSNGKDQKQGGGSNGGETKVKSDTPENKAGHINPSAPEDSNVTPGSAGEK